MTSLIKPGFGTSSKEARTNHFCIRRYSKLLLLFLILLSSLSAACDLSHESHVAIVGNVTLKIHDCTLQVHSDKGEMSFNTDFPGNCHFITQKDGSTQIVQTQFGPTLLIASSSPSTHDRFCHTRVRGILIHNNTALLSGNEKRISSCSPGPFDTKMFYVFAEHAEKTHSK